MSVRATRPVLHRVATGAWTAVPAVLAVGVLVGVGGAIVAMATVEGQWPAAGGYLAVFSGVALGVVEGLRITAVGIDLLRGSWNGQWLSLAGWLVEVPLVIAVLSFVAIVAFAIEVASRSPPGVGIGMTLVLFSVLALFAMVPLALLVLGRIAAPYLT